MNLLTMRLSKLFNDPDCMYTTMMRFLLIVISFLSVYSLQAQISEPVKWSFSLSSSNIHVGDTIEVIAKATIENNWYLYSTDFDPTLGPTVTTFTFTPNEGYALLGIILPIKAKKKFDAVFSGDVTYFIEHAEFRQKIIVLAQKPVIALMVEYQSCNDLLGRCIPGEEEHSFSTISVKPATKIAATTPVQPPVTPSNKVQSSGVKSTVIELEAEKEKMMETDAEGNDITVDYLKGFVKKYGK